MGRCLRFPLMLCVGLILASANPLWAAEDDYKTYPIFVGSAAIDPGSYHFTKFAVDPEKLSNPTVFGHLSASGGTGDDVEILVLTASDLENWKREHDTHPLYSSGRVIQADLNVPIKEAGTYYLVISNAFSVVTAKTAKGNIVLRTDVDDSGLGWLVILALAVGGFFFWRSRKKKAAKSA